MPHHRLKIHPAPFKPSHLSIPPSPFSPLSPLTPAAQPQSRPKPTSTNAKATPALPEPVTPLRWVWTCHACHAAYPLGATRRCLDDGHHFCAGTKVVKRWRYDGPKRRTKRHKACTSGFDYLGWKAWGRWKRSSRCAVASTARAGATGLTRIGEEGKTKDCWTDCDYPSQCRWGRRVGVHTPSPSPTRTTFSFDGCAVNTSVLNTPIDLPSLGDCFVTSPPLDTGVEGSVGALGRALEASAQRRKSLGSESPTSPLKMEFAQTSAVFDVEMADAEYSGYLLPSTATSATVDLSCIDPALLELSDIDTSAAPGYSASVPVDRVENDGRGRTVEQLKSLLSFSSPRPSRRHFELLPVSNAQRKLRRRHAMSGLTVQEPLVRIQESMTEGFSPLEGVKRLNENTLHVV
jgi:hypothetical protein